MSEIVQWDAAGGSFAGTEDYTPLNDGSVDFGEGGPDSRLKRWDGAAWQVVTIQRYDGSAWVQKPLKRYDGSAFVAA